MLVDRLREFIKHNNLSVREFERICDFPNGTIKSLKDSITTKRKETIVEKFPTINLVWLLTGEGEMLETSDNLKFSNVKPKIYPSHIEVRLVTNKARAGYTDSYYADEYLKDLPVVLVEADKEYKGKYMAFEVDGDSMEPHYYAGDIVIGREIKRDLWQYKLHYNDYDFIIAHGTKGIMLKEITNHDLKTGEIVCHSLNNEDGKHKDFTLNLHEVSFLYNVVEHRTSGRTKRRNR